jgi:hypothetical protein
MRLSPLGTWATSGPRMMTMNDNKAVGGIITGGGAEVIAENMPLCTTQIQHDLNWVRTQASAVRSRRVTA